MLCHFLNHSFYLFIYVFVYLVDYISFEMCVKVFFKIKLNQHEYMAYIYKNVGSVFLYQVSDPFNSCCALWERTD